MFEENKKREKSHYDLYDVVSFSYGSFTNRITCLDLYRDPCDKPEEM